MEPPLSRSLRLGRRAALCGLVGTALLPATARAHALVLASTPAAGARLEAAPPRASLRFNSRIDPARSRLTLHGPEGATQVLPLAPGAEPTELEADLPALQPGAWRLRWQVLATDGHITRGDIAFTILAPR